MIKVDLITGFLGSGKTTFIKKYAAYLIAQGKDIGILENDFGAVNVDMMLLQELRGPHCELEMVSACCGNDPEAHRRRFKTKLIAMGMSGYDRVLVEPSGIFDVDEFFDLLQEEPLDRWYEIGSVIAIVDARQGGTLSPEAGYILASEAADAGCVVLSKSQEATPKELEDTVEGLNQALARAKCGRRFHLGEDRTDGAAAELVCRDWALFEDADFAFFSSCGYRSEAYVKQDCCAHGGFESLFFMNKCLTEAQLRTAARRILEDGDCGSVFRIKGFQRIGENEWLELNATRREIRITPIRTGQEVLIVIGEHLKKERIERYLCE